MAQRNQPQVRFYDDEPATPEGEAIEGEYVELEEPTSDVEDIEGGGALVSFGDGAQDPEIGFFDNLVFELDQTTLSRIALDLLEKISYDEKAREKRNKMYAEGIRRTGLGDDAPGGAQFQGASRVVHPMLTQAVIEFESRAVKELFPASGPVKTHAVGENISKARWAKAERKTKFFNWQLRYQMTEFRPELEKVLTQSPLGGVAYQRYIWSHQMKRPFTNSCTSDQVLIPFASTSFYTSERITFIDDITEFEYKERVKSGMYRDADLVTSSMAPQPSKVQQAQNKVEGKTTSTYNEDGVRRTYECNTYLSGIEEAMGGPAGAFPYLVYLDETTKQVLAIVRNWEEQDEKCERMHWIVEWGFIPWTGAYPIGLMHMIGSLSGAATGALRALLDSAHVNNMPTAAILKGGNVGGQSKSLRATETTEIDGGVGADDVRKRVLPVTYNPPSEVLMHLLKFLVDSGESMVRVALDKLAQDNPNMPVGTMYAAIEQGLNVVGAIIGRYYYSMEMSLRVLHRINRMYITDDEIRDETGSLLARRADFQGPLDCIPVADPSTPSDAHRHAKVQAVSARAAQVPQLYNMHAVERMFLTKMMGYSEEEVDELLTPLPKAEMMNAVNENAAATLGRPVAAFPEQDHLAHIQTHVDYMESPLFGQLITIAPKFLPLMLGHLTEHISMWYVTQVYNKMAESMDGRDPAEYMRIRHPSVQAEMDKNLAMVSRDVVREDAQQLEQLPAIIQKAFQLMQQYQPPQPADPAQVQREKNQMDQQDRQQKNQLKAAELQQKGKETEMRLVVDNTKVQAQAQIAAADQRTREIIANAQELAESARLRVKEAGENRRAELAAATKLEANTDDNMTALSIAQAEIENEPDEEVDVETGSGINPNPQN